MDRNEDNRRDKEKKVTPILAPIMQDAIDRCHKRREEFEERIKFDESLIARLATMSPPDTAQQLLKSLLEGSIRSEITTLRIAIGIDGYLEIFGESFLLMTEVLDDLATKTGTIEEVKREMEKRIPKMEQLKAALEHNTKKMETEQKKQDYFAQLEERISKRVVYG